MSFASIVLKHFDFTSRLDLVDHCQCSTPLIEPQKLEFTGPSRLPRPFISDLSHSRQLRVCCSPWPHRCLGRHASLMTLLTTFGSSPPSILRQLVDLTSNCLSPFHWFVVNMSSLKHPKARRLLTLLVTTWPLPSHDNRICWSSVPHQSHCSLLPYCSSFSSYPSPLSSSIFRVNCRPLDKASLCPSFTSCSIVPSRSCWPCHIILYYSYSFSVHLHLSSTPTHTTQPLTI